MAGEGHLGGDRLAGAMPPLGPSSKHDVVVVGGGITGASVFAALAARGYRTLLVERGDFASGTSQASAMLVWGGLLYLSRLDLPTVVELCRSRDGLVSATGSSVSPREICYLTRRGLGRRAVVTSALWLYWLLGRGRRRRPRVERRPLEGEWLRDRESLAAYVCEEGGLDTSDARFVLERILGSVDDERLACNGTELTGGAFDSTDGSWHLELRDRSTGAEAEARAKVVVNCGGIAADRINERFGIEAEWRHALSRGVFLGVKRPPAHGRTLILDTRRHRDVIGLFPWGPISLWGPTETPATDLDTANIVGPEDADHLASEWRRHFREPLRMEDVVSVRSGVRPLAVPRSYTGERYPLELSRRVRLALDRDRPWISVYGGKITGSSEAATKVGDLVARVAHPTGRSATPRALPPPELVTPPMLDEAVPAPAWCRQHEACRTFEDYVRRRTPIAQHAPRGGCGRRGEHRDALVEIAKVFADGDDSRAARDVDRHVERIDAELRVVEEAIERTDPCPSRQLHEPPSSEVRAR